jgi:hypothetical protein
LQICYPNKRDLPHLRQKAPQLSADKGDVTVCAD